MAVLAKIVNPMVQPSIATITVKGTTSHSIALIAPISYSTLSFCIHASYWLLYLWGEDVGVIPSQSEVVKLPWGDEATRSDASNSVRGRGNWDKLFLFTFLSFWKKKWKEKKRVHVLISVVCFLSIKNVYVICILNTCRFNRLIFS